jgi:hypothetical protein
MKQITSFINEKYEYQMEILPFNAELIKDALQYYLDEHAYDRDKNKGAFYTVKNVEDTIKLFNNAKIKR